MTDSKDIREALASVLRRRLEIISDRQFFQADPSAHLALLQAVSQEITDLAALLTADADPHLAHYLQRASFDKALALLEAD